MISGAKFAKNRSSRGSDLLKRASRSISGGKRQGLGAAQAIVAKAIDGNGSCNQWSQVRERGSENSAFENRRSCRGRGRICASQRILLGQQWRPSKARRHFAGLLNSLIQSVSFMLRTSPIIMSCLRQTVDACIKNPAISLSLCHKDAGIGVMATDCSSRLHHCRIKSAAIPSRSAADESDSNSGRLRSGSLTQLREAPFAHPESSPSRIARKRRRPRLCDTAHVSVVGEVGEQWP